MREKIIGARAGVVLGAFVWSFAIGGALAQAEAGEGQPVQTLRAVVTAHHGSSYKHPGYTSTKFVSTPEAAYVTATEPRTDGHLKRLTEPGQSNVMITLWTCKRPWQTFNFTLTARGDVGATVTTKVTFHAELSARWCAAAKAREEAQGVARHKPEVIPTTTCTNGAYVNSAGDLVCKPEAPSRSGPPAGATAQCSDGTYSFSESRSGTCSSHGGVARWL